MASNIEVDKLLEARNWIADRNNWTTGTLARDLAGNSIGQFNPLRTIPKLKDQIYKTCGVGCLVLYKIGTGHTRNFIEEICKKRHGKVLAELNDSPNRMHGHSAVVAVFDEAIRLAKEL